MHKTSAWPLAWVYGGLIVYASLFPFEGWRDQGMSPWFFLTAPMPAYWTAFDVVANVLGYAPLGFFLALGALRTGRTHHVLPLIILALSVLSLLMETLQVYLPHRVPSNLDWILNGGGGTLGAVSAWCLEKWGFLQRWSRFRQQWFVEDARGGLVLLFLWPAALLFPTNVPLGLGQVAERLQAWMLDVLSDTPFLPLAEGLWPIPTDWQASSPWVEGVCVGLGCMMPILLGFSIVSLPSKRAWLLVAVCVLGGGASALSAALSVGPEHAWVWLTASVRTAWLAAVLYSVALIWVPCRVCAVIALPALVAHLMLINHIALGSYFEQTLLLWEQGRFIRFHGLAQWLGWMWPFALLIHLLSVLWSMSMAHLKSAPRHQQPQC